MPVFQYKALKADGGRVEGTLSAADRKEALAAVARRGLRPLTVAEAKRGGKSGWNITFGKPKNAALKAEEVLLFTGELADLLEAGMTLGAALRFRTRSRSTRIRSRRYFRTWCARAKRPAR